MTDPGPYVNARFRITAWPERVPLPGVLAGAYTLDGSHSALLGHFPERTYWSQGETYLALYAVDLDNADEILAFANDYAVLDGAQMLLVYEDANVVPHAEPDPVVLSAQRRAVSKGVERTVLYPEYLEDFRFAATALRDLTSAWRVASGQADPTEIAWTWLHGEQPTLEAAASVLAVYLPPLLRGLHPRLQLEKAEEGEPHVAVVVDGRSKRAASLFEVCAAELYNHIVARPTYKVCANETCQRLFVLQRGRAIHGQHRTTGVKYCSVSCARAQNQRKYRQRQTDRRSGSP
jgi:hypothetical protein